MPSHMIPWLIAALSVVFAALLTMLWHRKASLLTEELQRLRQTLNTWETQPAPVQSKNDKVLEMRLESLRTNALQLAKQISAKTNFAEPEECVTFFREAITTLSRANRKSKEQLEQTKSELKGLQKRLTKAEHALEETTDDPSTLGDQLNDVRALLAITTEDRDQLRYRIQEMANNRRR